jgi:hypothetical protein
MPEETNEQEKRFSTPQIAKAYGLKSHMQINNIIRAGKLPNTKSGRGYSIAMSEIVRHGVEERGMNRGELIAKLNEIYDRS